MLRQALKMLGRLVITKISISAAEAIGNEFGANIFLGMAPMPHQPDYCAATIQVASTIRAF